MGLDFSAISGLKAALITDGTINLDHPDGYVYNHCEYRSIIITLIGTEARATAAQYVVERTGADPNNLGRIILQGETKHVVPPIIKTIVDENWLAPAQKMQLGLRPVRTCCDCSRKYQLLFIRRTCCWIPGANNSP
eukprot:3417763-Pyramimonas_sp.AAC.1